MTSTNQETIGLTTSFRKAASTAFESALSEIDKNWEGACSGKDPDAIHDLRVGTRRLRAALSIYADVLPERELKRVERNISTLTDALGPARDADVLLEHLKSVTERYASENDTDAIGVRAFSKTVKQTRDREQKLLDKALNKFDIAELKSDLIPSAGKNTK